MKYSIGENQSCEAKGKIRQSQPLVGQDGRKVFRFEFQPMDAFDLPITWHSHFYWASALYRSTM